MRVRAGTLDELRTRGCLVAKAGPQPVCVFWHEGRAYALDDRCPHLGFPLHRGSVSDGLVTCHWHHARFDLASGGTLDPFADDARAYPVEIEAGDVFIVVPPVTEQVSAAERRLTEAMEQGLTLVSAKAVLALVAGAPGDANADGVKAVVRTALDFGTRYRRDGWGAGLTVLAAMANLLPHLHPDDQALALVHGVAFVSRDTRNSPPRFPLSPLATAELDEGRLDTWYRRFIDTRTADAGERTLVTAIERGPGPAAAVHTMLAAATDHVFLDGGHTLDFTNKAFEALDHVGWDSAGRVLPTLVRGTARAFREEEAGRWRHPFDLIELIERTNERLPSLVADGSARHGSFHDVGGLGWRLLADSPEEVVAALTEAIAAGARPEQLGRALAFAAGLRITRFHIQNDFGDWDIVHHAFTAANALHQCLVRAPSPELLRGVVHGALRVYLDRFLNVPAARLPEGDAGALEELPSCWDEQGQVDRAGTIAWGFLRTGGDPSALIAALGHGLLREDAGFHWFQTLEAAVRQFSAWPAGSDEGALLLVGATRFLAAHTPTRRELAHVVRTAGRLRRGEQLFEES